MHKTVRNDIARAMIKKKKTLAVAESVTSGQIQAALSLAKDARCFFQGGMVTYNLGQKSRQLQVDPIEAEESNCVSKKVASTMALNICKQFIADYGLSITGYASPVPEKNIHSLFAFVSICKDDRVILEKKITAKKETAEDVQSFYTQQALKLLASVL